MHLRHIFRRERLLLCLHLLRRGLDAPGSKVLLQHLHRPLQTVPPLLQAAHLLELGVELP